MRSFAILGLLIAAGLILLGYFARTPGQEALSNAVMAVGAGGIILVVIILMVFRFSRPPGGG